MNTLIRALSLLAAVFLASPCLAEMDSGGGLIAVENLNKYGSQDSPFTAETTAIGSHQVLGGLFAACLVATSC